MIQTGHLLWTQNRHSFLIHRGKVNIKSALPLSCWNYSKAKGPILVFKNREVRIKSLSIRHQKPPDSAIKGSSCFLDSSRGAYAQPYFLPKFRTLPRTASFKRIRIRIFAHSPSEIAMKWWESIMLMDSSPGPLTSANIWNLSVN